MMVGRGNGLLALTMGLGKTVSAIAAIEELRDNGAVSTGLIVVPSSLKFQWQREIKRFTGQLALVIDGAKAVRERLYANSGRHRYVITSYQSIVNDWTVVRNMDLDYIVIDEATAIKSFTAKRSKKIKFLGKRTPVRIALTGQPVENRPEELFSIMEFVDPDVLGPFDKFDRTFIVRNDWGRPERYRNLHVIEERLQDVMYRKTRADVADQFPKVNTSVIPFYLSDVEARLYERVAGLVVEKLDMATSTFGAGFNLAAHYGVADDPSANQMRGDIMAGVMMLRQITNDPNLVVESARLLKVGKGEGSQLAGELVNLGLFDNIPAVSSKRAAFKEYAANVLDDADAKLVAFSTFKGMLKYLAADTAKLTNSTSLTGDMPARARDDSIQKFKKDPGTRLFLSSDAGGYGVDLPNASHLVSLDLPWSTGSYEQREARIIRISSEFEQVFIGMLLAYGSIDMRMHEMIEQKAGVADAWLDGDYDDKGAMTLTLGSLRDFLCNSTVRR